MTEQFPLRISITEALVSELVERGGVDASNAIHLLRNAQANVAATDTIDLDLNARMDVDLVDMMVINASRNGLYDIFASYPAQATRAQFAPLS